MNVRTQILRVMLTATAVAWTVAACMGITQPRTIDPSTYEIRTLNGSTDGRYHTCGYVTEDGVTDHLGAYRERCGIQP